MTTTIPGTCCICQQTLPGDRIRGHLLHCIESRTGLKPAPDPRRRDRRRTVRKTAYRGMLDNRNESFRESRG